MASAVIDETKLNLVLFPVPKIRERSVATTKKIHNDQYTTYLWKSKTKFEFTTKPDKKRIYPSGTFTFGEYKPRIVKCIVKEQKVLTNKVSQIIHGTKYHKINTYNVLYTISTIVCTQYYDTGIIACTITLRPYAHLFHQTNVTNNAKFKSVKVQLRIDPQGRPVVMLGDKRVFKPENISLLLSFMKQLFLVIGKNHSFYEKINQVVGTKQSMTPNRYMLLRNPALMQLPIDPKNLEGLYLTGNLDNTNRRRRIMYHLSTGNTARATQEYLGGYKFPKSIRKLLLGLPPIRLDLLEKLNAYLQELDVNIVHSVIKEALERQIGRGRRSPLFVTINAILGYCRSFHWQHALQHNNLVVDCDDMVDMFIRHERYDDIIQHRFNCRTIPEYHDWLIIQTRELHQVRYFNQSEWAEKANEPWESKLQILETPDFIVRPVSFLNELVAVGDDMHICVSIYRASQFAKRIEIALVIGKKNNDYLGCLEIAGSHLVQAKLKYNRRISTDKKISDVTKEWLKLNKISINTNDMH